MSETIQFSRELFDQLAKCVGDSALATKEASVMITNQTKMLDILLEVVISIIGDDTADMRIRRRLAFAIKQVRGIGTQP